MFQLKIWKLNIIPNIKLKIEKINKIIKLLSFKNFFFKKILWKNKNINVNCNNLELIIVKL